MKIVSFNINGLRARPHQLQALIDKHQPDVIGLQETKVADEQFPEAEIRQLGYHVHYHGQKGHYGVALLSRQAPLEIGKGRVIREGSRAAILSFGTRLSEVLVAAEALAVRGIPEGPAIAEVVGLAVAVFGYLGGRSVKRLVRREHP